MARVYLIVVFIEPWPRRLVLILNGAFIESIAGQEYGTAPKPWLAAGSSWTLKGLADVPASNK
jgi:hypothetical protein